MRKREPDAPAITPRPCDHPDVTWQGETAPACLWGWDHRFPLPLDGLGSAEVDAMEAAGRAHSEFAHVAGVGIRLVAVAGMLMPNGEPWERHPRAETW